MLTLEFTDASDERKAHWLKLCREDMSYALCALGRPDGRIQGGIEMITRLLGDQAEWDAFKKRWGTPWDDTPSNWA